MHLKSLFHPALAMAIAFTLLPVNIHAKTAADTLDYSFVVVGCNRVNDPDTAGNPSTANVPQLNRLFTEVANLNPLPAYLFMAGDIILGYTKDTVVAARQLNAWVQLYQNSALASKSTKLVVVPGNHETQDKPAGKLSFPQLESTYLRIMAPYIVGSNGPQVDSTHGDSLKTDQSKLTYSFNYKTDHFVMLNTDPVGRDWRVPTNWISSDLSAARPNARHIFLIGHKPAYPGVKTATLDDGLAKYPANRDAFWTVLENNRTEAMFAAHVHVWDKIQPHPTKTWQIIAGNGGSQCETTWVNLSKPNPIYHGYTLVNVYTNGKVKVRSMGHDIDNVNYFQAVPASPTTLRDSAEITWGVATSIHASNRSLNSNSLRQAATQFNAKSGEVDVVLPNTNRYGTDGKEKGSELMKQDQK